MMQQMFIGLGAADKYWIATLGGSSSDSLVGIDFDGLGNVYSIGNTESEGQGSNDILIAKYNSSGTLLWQRILGGTGSDFGIRLKVSGSDVYIIGQTGSTGTGGNDLIVAKYNTSGTIQWQRTLNGVSTSDDVGRDVEIDSLGNIYVCGRSDVSPTDTESKSMVLAKYNSSGTIQWQRAISTSTELTDTDEYAYGLAVDSSDNIYICGQIDEIFSDPLEDYLIAKYDSSGTIQWAQTLAGTSGGNDRPSSIEVDSLDDVYVCGYGSPGGGVFVKLNGNDGLVAWQRTITDTFGGALNDVSIDGSDNIYVCGRATPGGPSYALILKYNTSGTLQWQRSLSGSNPDVADGITVGDSDDIYISGFTFNGAQASSDALIARLPNDGSLTGTYGNFTYSDPGLTETAGTFVAFPPAVSTKTTISDVNNYWIVDFGNTRSNNQPLGFDVDSSNGAVYLTAFGTLDDNAAGSHFMCAEFSSSGILEWCRRIDKTGGSFNEYGYGVKNNNTSDVYVAGELFDSSYVGLLAKFNTSGGLIWQRTFDLGSSTDVHRRLTAIGNDIYVTGYTFSVGQGNADVYIAKYDSSGNLIWTRTLGGTSSDYSTGIDTDGSDIYVCGYTRSSGAGSDDLFLAKYNTSGTIQWQRTLGGTSTDQGHGIAVDSSGNSYVVGYTASEGQGSNDILIAKYNSSGTIQWQRTLGGTFDDSTIFAVEPALDSSGNLFICGTTRSAGQGSMDAIIAKYNSSGTIQWQRTFGGLEDDQGRGIKWISGGIIYLTIETESAPISAFNNQFNTTTRFATIVRLPDDGSSTGTYGNYTYASSSLTPGTSSLTDQAGTLTSGSPSATSSTPTITEDNLVKVVTSNPSSFTDASSSLTPGTPTLTPDKTPIK